MQLEPPSGVMDTWLCVGMLLRKESRGGSNGPFASVQFLPRTMHAPFLRVVEEEVTTFQIPLCETLSCYWTGSQRLGILLLLSLFICDTYRRTGSSTRLDSKRNALT